MTYEEIFAQAKLNGLILNNLYQLSNGDFRCNFKIRWHDVNGREYCWFSNFKDAADPRDALEAALTLAVETQPHDEPETPADTLGLFG